MRELEIRARRIAAERCGLVMDPEGKMLPDDLWQQAIPQAKKEMMRGTIRLCPECAAYEAERLLYEYQGLER